MRKTIWVGMAGLLTLSMALGCAGNRLFTPAGSSMAKNDWRSPKGAQPLGTQQAMGKGTATPPPQFPTGQPSQMNANAFGQAPLGITSPGMSVPGGSGDPGVQQTQYQQDPRRPIATNAGEVNKTMLPANPTNTFGGLPPGSTQGQLEPMSISPGATSYPEPVPPALMNNFP